MVKNKENEITIVENLMEIKKLLIKDKEKVEEKISDLDDELVVITSNITSIEDVLYNYDVF